MGQDDEADDRSRYTADRQTLQYGPIYRVVETVDRSANAFGRRRIEQVRADRDRRVKAESENQQRGHQRSAAHARQADEHAHKQTGERIERLNRGHAGVCPLIFMH